MEHRYGAGSERFSPARADFPRLGGKEVTTSGASFRSFPAILERPRFPDCVRRRETLGGGGGLGIQDWEAAWRSFRGELPLLAATRGEGKFQ